MDFCLMEVLIIALMCFLGALFYSSVASRFGQLPVMSAYRTVHDLYLQNARLSEGTNWPSFAYKRLWKRS